MNHYLVNVYNEYSNFYLIPENKLSEKEIKMIENISKSKKSRFIDNKNRLKLETFLYDLDTRLNKSDGPLFGKGLQKYELNDLKDCDVTSRICNIDKVIKKIITIKI